ncbi:MAG: hypothetical protein KA260_02485 [Burkholderiales bacterium]|nr:hypothetical protein [Burkholderiales bacterium]
MMQLFTLRNALVAAAIGLIAAFGYETDWGDAFSAPPIPTRQSAAKHDSAAVLPDFRLSSEANAYSQITERPLLNPSRKPAPTQAPVAAATEPPKPQIRRGLYTVVGVTDLGSVKIAQLREASTGRIKSVQEGDALQEMKVAKIDGDRVTLAFMGETDVINMAKFTASGRVPQPAVAAAPPPAPLPVPVPAQPANPQLPTAKAATAQLPPQNPAIPGGQPLPDRNAVLSGTPLPNGQPYTSANAEAFIEARRRARFNQ